MKFELCLQVLCGVFWIIAYILIIHKSFKDKTYGIPLFALSLNLAWEFTFSFIYPPGDLLFAKIIFLTWLLLDLIILYTFFKYGYKSRKYIGIISKKSLYIFTVFILVCSILFMILSVNDFSILFNNDITQTSGFIANIQNLIMSILFVSMLLNRGNTSGQSIYIAIFKWMGTLTVAILKFTNMLPSITTELFIIALIQFFDILYIYLIYKFSKTKNALN
ncbi:MULTISPECIES: transmembrane-type terpene cyclase [Paraclostridium]|uniref:transmembrane-type terpene cyclase n=1 Tax=Paraclostridium TaxID=1849822 RepID=UPI00051CDBBF|nr:MULTISPECIES: hypothetical protein [Paraclostridium]KGJ49553.1 hypothetical protein KD33_06120 [Clostridium sp. NCR]MCU9812075.1 hypothetical protein [Paraclostridium sp. AKS81]